MLNFRCGDGIMRKRRTDSRAFQQRLGLWSSVVFVMAGGSEATLAQGVPASGTVVAGSAEITTGPLRTDIAVASREAIINWVFDERAYAAGPFANAGVADLPSGTVNFLPATNTMRFNGQNSESRDFTVLNRLLVPGPALLNGKVQSFIGSDIRGNVWFSSPTGMIVGPDARFNTGSLVLTANNIDTSDGLFGSSGEIRFRRAAANAAIDIRRGALVSAVGSNESYLAIVAPRIVQSARIRSNGSIALVAAERVDIRIDTGLLDIEVYQGTDDPNGIVHTGVTEALPFITAARTIAIAAVPKNEALTMLLSGAIGYEPATQAIADGTAILLSAGPPSNQTTATGVGSIRVSDIAFTSPVTAIASGSIDIAPTANGLVDFQFATTLSAGDAVRLVAGDAGAIRAGSSLDIDAGSEVGLAADGGTISTGSLRLDAGEAGPGKIALSASRGGLLSIDGNLTANAGGPGTGGSLISLSASGAPIAIAGFASASADGDVALTSARGGGVTIGRNLAISASGKLAGSGSLVAGGNIDVVADGGIALTDLASGGSTSLTSTGAVKVSRNLRSQGGIIAGGSSVELDSTGSLDLLDISAGNGDARITAGGDIRSNGTAAATGAVQFVAGGNVELNGNLVGNRISIISSDLAIGSESLVGARGTTRSIELANGNGSIGATIGGSGQSRGYDLDADELGRLFADETILLRSSGDITVQNLGLGFGAEANIGSGGALLLRTPATVRVIGDVALTPSGNDDSLAIEATRIEIPGTIALRDAAGALRGRLALEASTIIAADNETIAKINLDDDTAALGTMLGVPSAKPRDEGYLLADRIEVGVRDAFLVQNSGGGEADSRRGFSANALDITTRSADALIAINGQTFDARGAPVRGLDTAATIAIDGRYRPLSSVNGCALGSDCSETEPSGPPEGGKFYPPASEIILGPIDGLYDRPGTASNGEWPGRSSVPGERIVTDVTVWPMDTPLVPSLIFLQQPDPARQEPLLDEPVTGVGNDDLWQGNCGSQSAPCPGD